MIRLAWIRLGKRVLVLTALLGAAACPGQGTTGQKSETTEQDDHATGQQSGTKGTTQMTTIEQRWKVFDGPTLILEVSSVPGPIISTAAPPPGLKPVTRPFLSATARSAQHEHRLREILVASKDLGDFVRACAPPGSRSARRRNSASSDGSFAGDRDPSFTSILDRETRYRRSR